MSRDANVIAALGIISCFLDIRYLVKLTVVSELLGQIEHDLVLLLQGINMFLNFIFGLVELLSIIILLS